jgi:hypothetical protein
MADSAIRFTPGEVARYYATAAATVAECFRPGRSPAIPTLFPLGSAAVFYVKSL